MAKNILAPLGMTAAASAIDAGILKKRHGSGTMHLIIWNEEINDIFKAVQTLADSNILLKGINKKRKRNKREKKRIFRNVIPYFKG